MNIQRNLAHAISTLAVLALASACGKQPEPTGHQSTPEQPVAGGTLTSAVEAEPENLNPMIYTSTYAGDVMSILHEPVVSMNDRFEWEPTLCESWEWSADHLVLTFHIRKGIRWNDGAPFSAYDVASTYRLCQNPDVPYRYRSNFVNWEGVEAADSSTVVIRYKVVYPDQMFDTNFHILPAHIVDALDPKTIAEWPINRQPVTLGAYRLAQWVPGQQLVLERNPLYFGKAGNFDRIVLKITPEETVRLLQLENGEVDMVETIPTKDIARLRNNPDLKLYPLRGRLLGYLQYNLRKPTLADPRVRHAISLAIDRTAMVEGLMYGFAQPAGSVMAPVLGWPHDASLAPDPHAPERARALLAEAGWTDRDGDGVVDKDGQPLALEIKTRTGDPVREDGVIIVQENLSRVGIRATPRLLELATVLDQLKVGEFDIYYGQFRARLSPDITSLFGSAQTHERGGSNYGGYSNPQVDALMGQAVDQLDPQLARPLWHQVQRMIYEDQPWTMLYYRDQVVGINRRFRDCTPHVLSAYYGIERWWEAVPAAGQHPR
jgi:peptide/nickel transport system substrate-binding protein